MSELMPPEPTEAKPGSERSLRANIMLGTAPRVITILAALVVSPVIVAHLGLATYGFWALLQGLVMYAQLADGGFPSAGTALVGRAKDHEAVRSVVAVVTATMVPVGIVIVALTAGIVYVIPASWSGSFPVGWQEAAVAVSATVAFTMIAAGFASGVAGLERWDLQATGYLLNQVVASGATVIWLWLGGGLVAVALSLMAGAAALCVWLGVQAYRLGSLRFHRRLLKRDVMRELFGQGMNMQVVAFVTVTTAQADRYMLLPFASLKWIGAYDLGARVALSLKVLPTSALGPIITRLATTHGREGLQGIKNAYIPMFRNSVGLGVVMLIAAYGAAYPAVLAWLGPSFTTSAGVAALIGLCYALNFATAIGTSAARAAGRADIDRNYTLVVLVLNLLCTVAFGLVWGAWGVVAATTVSGVLGSIWLIIRVDRWLDTNALKGLLEKPRSELLAVLQAFVIGAATIACSMIAADFGAGRLEQLLLSGISVAASAAILGGKPLRSRVMSRLRPA